MKLVCGVIGTALLLSSARLGFASCPDDDPDGSKVAAARATAEQQCHDMGMGCDNAPTHGAYVSCVAHVANDLASGASPSLPRSCKGAVKKCAARSTCGRPGSVTCCRTHANGATTCSIKRDASRCTAQPGPGACVSGPASCCDACTATGCAPTTTTTTTTPCSYIDPGGACNLGDCGPGYVCTAVFGPPPFYDAFCDCAQAPACAGSTTCGGNCPQFSTCGAVFGACGCQQ